MDKPIIEIKNISKKYKITHERGGYITLRDVLMNIFKRPFSYLKTKAKSVAGLTRKEDFWALKDVNFTVNRGEVIGIIGRNGAGKSTLLKILSQITPPTEGEIIMRGTVGSLLEVGTGFHPELTGRENISLNGAILGMSRKEIANKFDQIVEFAGIDKFLDTPVKYYSSGMYVRLAFSVAAHMEPDILLVDEVLAVGDAEFQKKCLGKMEEVTKKDGRTIIFVSHNMGAISNLCKKTILLERGEVVKYGETKEVINYYNRRLSSLDGQELNKFDTNKDDTVAMQVTKITPCDDYGKEIMQTEIKKDIFVDITYFINKPVTDSVVAILISKDELPILYSYDVDLDEMRANREIGKYKTHVKLPFSIFKEGIYKISVLVGHGQENLTDPRAFVYITSINSTIDTKLKGYREDRLGFLLQELNWQTEKLS